MHQTQVEGAKAVNLFPTSVWIFPPQSEEVLNTHELKQLSLELQKRDIRTSGKQRSARKTWRLESPHTLTEFESAFNYIQRTLSKTCTTLGLQLGNRAFDSWLDVVDPGGYHVIHQHSPNILSGVIHLSDCTETGRLVLRDPRPGRHCRSESQPGPTEVPVSAAAGSAIIFPAWLEHWVEENDTEGKLVYIAFNLGDLTSR
jgi:uncharacterized protein (TIGR02466 family)